MQYLTLNQALYMAAVDHSDDPFVRDCKFSAWLRSVKGQVVADESEPVPPETQVVILIKKEI